MNEQPVNLRQQVGDVRGEEARRLLDTLSSIVNVRSYTADPVSPDAIALLFDAFRLGPSLANTQPAEIVRVSEQAVRERVAKATLDAFLREGSYGGQEWIQEAPELMVIVMELRRAEARLGPTGRSIAASYAFASIQNLRVAAASLGLTSACVIEFDSERLREAVALPWYVEPLAIVTVGYPRGPVEPPPRLTADEVLHADFWNGQRRPWLGGDITSACGAEDKGSKDSLPVMKGDHGVPQGGSGRAEEEGVARSGSLPLRRSVRQFRAEPVPAAILEAALAEACRAPSSGNMQPWEFIVVDDPHLKEELVATTYTGYEKSADAPQRWMLGAPVIVAVCANLKRTRARYGPDGDQWAPLDTAAAAENFLLALSGLGLGSCWVGGFRAEETSRLLGLPEPMRIIGLFPVGYPLDQGPVESGVKAGKGPSSGTRKPWLKPRISLELVTHRNRFDVPYRRP